MGRLEGKVILVTGAAHGIGRAALERFAAEGAHLVAVDREEEALLEAVAALEAEALAVPADLADPQGVEGAFAEALEEFGRLDGVAHFAGVAHAALSWKLSLADWERVLGVNLTGSFLVARKAGEVMQGGSLVLTGSVAALGALGLAHYAASKAALLGLVRTLALELAPKGIRVNLLVPGLIETRMTAGLPEWSRAQEVEASPLKRPGRPEEVAQAALFLLSEESGFITGQALFVDGGRSVLGPPGLPPGFGPKEVG
ncbi:MAG: SDR family oxidoreductase [Thermus sp.]|uniref:SDR family NAD(P)-dependent oxidoreductase n=1 Tax=unclassified Thermus TaxID=2619321 RepID=UPI000238A3AA|nr:MULTISPECIES: SDR family NAD(P)-dependent oxidoreductase [unclassified Thermus]AEV15147.1 3-oxoacyl-[acyl carrier protein] reductase [Thermus sp. CCB_US3_UF1]MCS7219210.1 SDR family oxidoreductase [Thermus sp.]MCX7850455.1 SDR family oxidoreductase [Thermus sp.]MDW8018278.1 SDR family NAD(P)-dependent oxidoreductase [Thermus sp.]